jgi:hypothetical protein
MDSMKEDPLFVIVGPETNTPVDMSSSTTFRNALTRSTLKDS